MTTIVDLSVAPSGRFCSRIVSLAGDEVRRFSGLADRSAADTEGVQPQLRDSYLSDGVPVTTVDWSQRSDRSMVEEAIRRADAVLSSFHAGRFESPFDVDRVRQINPRAVHVVVSPFGFDGPYRDLPSSSLIDWAAGGYLQITGDPHREPLAGPSDVCAFASGYVAAIALEAGLAFAREKSDGVVLDISHMESMLSLHQSVFPRLAAGEVTTRTGNYVGPTTYPHDSYPCRTGELFLGIVSDEEWDRFLIAIDRADVCNDPRLENGRTRAANAAFVDRIVIEWTQTQGATEAAEHLQRAKVPATVHAQPEDVIDDPQLTFRGYWRSMPVGTPATPAQVPGNVLVKSPVEISAASNSPEAPRSQRPLPLTGIRVLDISLWWAGPMATRILGDLGADVIRVERPTLPRDPMQWPSWHQFVREQTNRNKRSLVADLRSKAGRQLVESLIDGADVLIQNFRPGVMDRLGFGLEAVCERNPRLVYVSLSGYGSAGPKSSWGTYGTLSEAASSVRALTHYPGQPGMRLGDQLPDAICGLVGALAALRGLRERAVTGRGGAFDISQLESYVALIGPHIAAASFRSPAAAAPSPGEGLSLTGIYKCAGEDQWLAVTADERDAVRRLESVLHQFKTRDDDPRTVVDLKYSLTNWAKSRTKHQTATILQRGGVTAFPVMAAADLTSDPHLLARRFFIECKGKDSVALLPGSPIRSPDHQMTSFRLAAPIEGQDTSEILSGELGMKVVDVSALVDLGVVSQSTARTDHVYS